MQNICDIDMIGGMECGKTSVIWHFVLKSESNISVKPQLHYMEPLIHFHQSGYTYHASVILCYVTVVSLP